LGSVKTLEEIRTKNALSCDTSFPFPMHEPLKDTPGFRNHENILMFKEKSALQGSVKQ